MFSIFSKKSHTPQKESIFLHIPKSGGSTFVGLLQASANTDLNVKNSPTHQTDKVGLTSIKHVNFSNKSRKFKGIDIFDISKASFYNNKEVFMLLRNPVDRLISEFNFQYHILDGKNGNKQAAILTNLKKQPKSVEEYIECKETQNYQLKFLLGRPINDPKKVINIDFEKIVERIEKLPIHCGVTDEYASFLNLFEDKTGTILPKKVIVRKKTPFLYHTEVTEKVKQRIIELNEFDYKLYMNAKNSVIVNNKKFKFIESDQFIV